MADNLLTRRGILAGAAKAGLVGGLVVAAGAAAADTASQLRKQDVHYQDQPKGSQRCVSCKNFVDPNACRVVSGSVNPNGWCLLYQAKAA